MNIKEVDQNLRISDEIITLRPITEADTPFILATRNSESVVANFFYRIPVSESDHKRWLEEKCKKGLVYQFVIEANESGDKLGCVYLQKYDERTNSMESGIFMAENAPLGQGIATRALTLLDKKYGFEMLGLSEINAKILSTNSTSIHLHEKVGFVKEGEEDTFIEPGKIPVRALKYRLTSGDK